MVVDFKTGEDIFLAGKVGALATFRNTTYARMKVEHGHTRGSKGVANTKADATAVTEAVVNRWCPCFFGYAYGVFGAAVGATHAV